MRSPAKLLLVDDRPDSLLTLEAVLEPLGARLITARSGEEALAALLRHDFAAVLLDVEMPGLDGYETAHLIKSRERTRHVPLIFLTGHDNDPAIARRGYDVGAVDYLFKPLDPIVLRSKAAVFIDLFHLKREAEELAHRALHDPLTGLPNRTLFRDRLELALERAERSRSAMGAFYIDLDGFKPVNDRFGHHAGDAVLVGIGQRLRGAMRGVDTIARLGGDEFAVLSDQVAGMGAAVGLAERILTAIEAPLDIEGVTVSVSASIGVVLAKQARDPEAVLRAADEAMYAAKQAGGGIWRVRTDPPAVAA